MGDLEHMKTIILCALFLTSSLAFANVTPPDESLSRALQVARRVASMENDHDLPSRAVWLGQRVAKNSIKLASKDNTKGKKKTRITTQN